MAATSRRVIIILSTIGAFIVTTPIPAAFAARSHVYTYKVFVLAETPTGSSVKAVCTGASAVIPGTRLREYSPDTASMFARLGKNFDNASFNVTLNTKTKLTATGPYAKQVHSVCAMNEKPISGTESGEANTSVFTWRLKQSVTSLAALVTHPATEAEMSTQEMYT
jgi:hypothetical protein